MVLVPTQEAADRFIQAGYDSEQLLVTGLCIEPALVRQAKDSFELRMKRIDKSDTLTGALFSSGAEPGAHLQRLMAITRSLLENGHRAVVVTTERGRLDHAITELAERSGYVYSALSNRSEIPYDLPPLTIVRAADRRDESRLVAQLFPSFDFVVAPPHERTNWGIGLGLPFFAITPCYGSFAPLNLELLLAQGVGRAVSSSSEALHFASSLKRLSREGGLAKMALNGWERAPINGFSTIAAWLAERLTKPDHA